jgi:hypothetical protein
VVHGAAEAELAEPGLAERHETRGAVHPGEVAVDGDRARDVGVGAVLGGHPRDVDVVLEEGRHAGEEAGSRGAGLVPRVVERLVGQRPELVVDGLGAGDRRLHHVAHRQPVPAGLDEADRVEVLQGVVAEGVHAGHGGKPRRRRAPGEGPA